MKTFEDLIAAIGSLSQSFKTLADTVSTQAKIDYSEATTIITNLESQVKDLVGKISGSGGAPAA